MFSTVGVNDTKPLHEPVSTDHQCGFFLSLAGEQFHRKCSRYPFLMCLKITNFRFQLSVECPYLHLPNTLSWLAHLNMMFGLATVHDNEHQCSLVQTQFFLFWNNHKCTSYRLARWLCQYWAMNIVMLFGVCRCKNSKLSSQRKQQDRAAGRTRLQLHNLTHILTILIYHYIHGNAFMGPSGSWYIEFFLCFHLIFFDPVLSVFVCHIFSYLPPVISTWLGFNGIYNGGLLW